MEVDIVESAMSFSTYCIDIPALPSKGDLISIYCKCPDINVGTRDCRQDHIPNCPGTINWYVRSISFHGTFPKGYEAHRDRVIPVKTGRITIGVDTRNPYAHPEIYGFPPLK